ncbi:contractile injection system protein, VgrG/Pvc8 family [Acinetobacter dispersus]|uniref:contractile injection system protein, VgrG/Pvc8 family n=1 Tax=Acinetobacter dispersus TaxID=70348 RepID=UPI001D197662|nr:contractile injection system protein, VgrG/Pvc8 family [Acinetobacter dispersus]
MTADNKPLNNLITSRIMTVSVTDNRADEADQINITLNDHDGALELPKRGVKINCKLGWLGEPLHDKGDFIVDGTELGGPPDVMTIRGSSANFRSNIKTAKSKSFHGQTLGVIAQSVAKEHNLKLNINGQLASIAIQHVDQTNESDLNFLKRLAKQNGAEMTIKKDRLLIFQAGSGLSASGKNLQSFTIARSKGDQWRYAEEDRDSDHTGVAAKYQDKGDAKAKKVTAGQEGKIKTIKGTFANKDEAQRAAEAEKQKIDREKATFSFNTAYGVPEVSTETPVIIQGFKKQADKLKWIVAKATHNYNSSGGLSTQLEMEANI